MSDFSACAFVGRGDGINQAVGVAIPELSSMVSRPKPVAMALKPAGKGRPRAPNWPVGGGSVATNIGVLRRITRL